VAIESGGATAVPFVLGTNADEGTILVSGAAVDTAAEYERTLVELGGAGRLDALRATYPVADYDYTAAAARAVTDILFSCPSRRSARDFVAAGGRAWVYRFTHLTALGEAGFGSFHGAELFVLFRNGALRPEDEALGERMRTYWAQHATDGEPGTAGALAWPAFEPAAEPFLELGTPVRARAGWPDGARCDALDAIFGTGL
jgi:para-nitrobenzyl esterase